MAEPVLPDPMRREPVRRRGPEPVRAGASRPTPAAEKVGKLPVDRELPATTTSAEAGAARISASGSPRTAPTPAPAPGPRPHTPLQEVLRELRTRLDELRERVEKQAEASGRTLRRELTEDAEYVKIRARYYHQRRPLQALGMVAMGTFVLGLCLGLWRR